MVIINFIIPREVTFSISNEFLLESIEFACQKDEDCHFYSSKVTISKCNGTHCICEDKFVHNPEQCKPQVTFKFNKMSSAIKDVSHLRKGFL